MIYAFCILGGLLVGGVVAWLIAINRNRSQFMSKLNDAERRISNAEGKASVLDGTIRELYAQKQRAAEDFEKLRNQLQEEQHAKVEAETRLTETIKRMEEDRKLLDEAKIKLTDTFKAVAGDTLDNSTTAFLKLAKETFERVLTEARVTSVSARKLYKV